MHHLPARCLQANCFPAQTSILPCIKQRWQNTLPSSKGSHKAKPGNGQKVLSTTSAPHKCSAQKGLSQWAAWRGWRRSRGVGFPEAEPETRIWCKWEVSLGGVSRKLDEWVAEWGKQEWEGSEDDGYTSEPDKVGSWGSILWGPSDRVCRIYPVNCVSCHAEEQGSWIPIPIVEVCSETSMLAHPSYSACMKAKHVSMAREQVQSGDTGNQQTIQRQSSGTPGRSLRMGCWQYPL